MGIKFSKGWDLAKRAFNRERVERVQGDALRKEVRNQLHLLRRDIIRYIDSEKHGVPNSPLTILIKGSSKPLVDHGDLRASVNIRTRFQRGLVVGGVGVLRQRRSKDGRSLHSIAIPLHEGFTVKVTPKVRAAVFAELRKRQGKRVKVPNTPGGGASTWKVKGRPYVRAPFEAAETRIKEALGDAVQLSLKKI